MNPNIYIIFFPPIFKSLAVFICILFNTNLILLNVVSGNKDALRVSDDPPERHHRVNIQGQTYNLMFFKLSITLCIFVSLEILVCLLIVLIGFITILPIDEPRFTFLVPFLVFMLWTTGVTQWSNLWPVSVIAFI